MTLHHFLDPFISFIIYIYLCHFLFSSTCKNSIRLLISSIPICSLVLTNSKADKTTNSGHHHYLLFLLRLSSTPGSLVILLTWPPEPHPHFHSDPILLHLLFHFTSQPNRAPFHQYYHFLIISLSFNECSSLNTSQLLFLLLLLFLPSSIRSSYWLQDRKLLSKSLNESLSPMEIQWFQLVVVTFSFIFLLPPLLIHQ